MDFQSAMETFAEAWVAANAGQQSQALALTRAANAAAAVAAATAAKSPSAQLADIAVKKEHPLLLSPSPSSSHSAPLGAVSGSTALTTTTSGAAAAAPTATGGDETLSHRRRTSIQGVQEKLTQLQMQPASQPQQQQQQQQANEEPADGTSQHARYPASAVGRRSTDDCSPVASGSGDNNNAAAAALAAVSANAPIEQQQQQQHHLQHQQQHHHQQQQQQRNTIGSITCLPPSALNAVAAAAAASCSQQQQQQQQQQLSQSQAEKLLPSPAGSMDNRRDFDVSKVNSKSLPLHCIVESVHSLQASLTLDTRNPWKRRPNIETDSYVIVAAATPWSEIVQTALQRLGYSQETACTARGALIIKNWKPIPLEQISDNPMVPVCDIIGELTSVITLRIVILRTKASPFGEIKDKLLKLLVLQSHAVLRSTGCPLDEMALSQICRSSYQNTFAFPGADISDDVRRKFDQWWSNQLSPQASMTPKMLPFMTTPSSVPNEMDFPTAAVAAAAAAAAAAHAGLHAASGAGQVQSGNLSGMGTAAGISASRESLLLNDGASQHGVVGGGVPVSAATHHASMMVHPAMHASMHHHHPAHAHAHAHGHAHAHAQYPTNQKTRMRTSFDPEMELPKLQKWFQENPHPSRQQIQTYVVQLNALESRRGRKPLDVNNVVYWFKNARAAQKRAEMRGGLSALGHAAINGYLSQHSQLGQNSGSSAGSIGSSQQLGGGGGGGSNIGSLSLSHDYLKSPLSLKSDDIEMSQHSDDMDEDTSRPCSPQLPLSLTTHERHRTTPADDDEEESRRGGSNNDNTSLKDEAECSDLLKTPLNQQERSRSRSYNEDEPEAHSKTNEPHAELKESESSDDQRANLNDSEANNNNNSTNSNNNTNNNNSTSTDFQSPPQLQQQQVNSSPKLTSPKEEEEDLDMDEDDEDNENDTSQLEDFRSPSPDLANAMAQRKDLPFPMVPNSMFSQSFMYMSHYMPGFGQTAAGHPHAHHAAAAAAAAGMQQNPLMAASGLNLSNEERRKRNRTFIDPVTEVPKLEQWFALNTHPSHNLILKYTEDLNTMPYRQKFPRLESKNVQFWFKNRRAKCKRLKMSLYDNAQCTQLSGLNSFVHKYEERD